MNAASRRALRRSPFRAPLPPTRAQDRPLSDMAAELLAEIIAGLRVLADFDPTDERVLQHFLQARGPVDAKLAAKLELDAFELRRRVASIHAATGTQTRRQLLTLGLALARRQG